MLSLFRLRTSAALRFVPLAALRPTTAALNANVALARSLVTCWCAFPVVFLAYATLMLPLLQPKLSLVHLSPTGHCSASVPSPSCALRAASRDTLCVLPFPPSLPTSAHSPHIRISLHTSA
ncbi:hypothetical protein C8J57DRAFT_1527159 [Mycena rebaudengoi]|nr:hypothetical protein C8J57DRAFT_1527159 [Mycena rebaudengoi]